MCHPVKDYITDFTEYGPTTILRSVRHEKQLLNYLKGIHAIIKGHALVRLKISNQKVLRRNSYLLAQRARSPLSGSRSTLKAGWLTDLCWNSQIKQYLHGYLLPNLPAWRNKVSYQEYASSVDLQCVRVHVVFSLGTEIITRERPPAAQTATSRRAFAEIPTQAQKKVKHG